MTAEDLEKFRNLLLKWREDLQSTSGEPINPKHLELDPTSRHCITCAR